MAAAAVENDNCSLFEQKTLLPVAVVVEGCSGILHTSRHVFEKAGAVETAAAAVAIVNAADDDGIVVEGKIDDDGVDGGGAVAAVAIDVGAFGTAGTCRSRHAQSYPDTTPIPSVAHHHPHSPSCCPPGTHPCSPALQPYLIHVEKNLSLRV